MKWEIRETITFCWDVEADTLEEAIAKAEDMGENTASTIYGGRMAYREGRKRGIRCDQ